MGLLSTRQIFEVTTDYQQVFSGERGGCVSIGSFSGLIACAYHVNPSGHIPLGIQMADIEFLDLSREFHPGGWGRGQREVGQPMDQILIVSEGELITDFVHVDGYQDIRPGTTAYLGPSGMLSSLPDWSGYQVGRFLSSVGGQGLPQHDSNQVMVMGGGLSYSYGTPYGQTIIVNPTDIRAYTPGWVKIRISL